MPQDWRTQLLSVSGPRETPGLPSLAVTLGCNNRLVLPTLSVSGHTHFPAFQETVDSGPGNLAPPSGFADWDPPSIHATYTDGSFPFSASEGFLAPDFYPLSDPGRAGPFPMVMEVNYRCLRAPKNFPVVLSLVVQACHPSYSGGRGRKIETCLGYRLSSRLL